MKASKTQGSHCSSSHLIENHIWLPTQAETHDSILDFEFMRFSMLEGIVKRGNRKRQGIDCNGGQWISKTSNCHGIPDTPSSSAAETMKTASEKKKNNNASVLAEEGTKTTCYPFTWLWSWTMHEQDIRLPQDFWGVHLSINTSTFVIDS